MHNLKFYLNPLKKFSFQIQRGKETWMRVLIMNIRLNVSWLCSWIIIWGIRIDNFWVNFMPRVDILG